MAVSQDPNTQVMALKGCLAGDPCGPLSPKRSYILNQALSIQSPWDRSLLGKHKDLLNFAGVSLMTMGYHGILTATRFGYGAPRSYGEIYPSVVENCAHTHTHTR